MENITEEQIMQWRKHFPFKSGARENQANAIEFAIRSFVSGKRFVVLEAATGVGKSAIGLTVARWLNEFLPEEDESAYKPGAYFMTTQKILQEQYMKDFGEDRGGTMRQLMSSSNYTCKFHKKQTCAESLRMLKIENDKESKFYRCCSFGCVYKEEKRKFIEHRESLTNFAYFLAETYYAGKLEPRSLLVIDEAHNADLELCGFVEISFSERFAKTALKVDMPEINTQLQSINWVKTAYLPKLRDHIKHYEDTIEKFNLGEKLESNFANIAKQYEMLDKHICKINRFLEIYDDENWVFNLVEGEGSGMRKLEFKPVDVSPYSESILFNKGRRILMMSATILNHEGFCEMLGIKDEDASFISIPSPFPPENHPIITAPVARMTANNIDADLPKLAEAIRSILESHSDVKGIIHTHSYKVAKYLRENIKDKRLLFHGAEDRLEKLSKHMNSKEPTVLVSPSMQEGVDLKDDLSRFQIICKVPYPYLGDKIVKKRMNRWKWWYPLQTAKTIVQSIGRSVRSSTDHATSYILDADWDRFYSKHSHLFPDTFQKSLK